MARTVRWLNLSYIDVLYRERDPLSHDSELELWVAAAVWKAPASLERHHLLFYY